MIPLSFFKELPWGLGASESFTETVSQDLEDCGRDGSLLSWV